MPVEWDLSPEATIAKQRLIWATDLHFNLAEQELIDHVMDTFAKTDFEAVLITGDVTDGVEFAERLKEIRKAADKPVYFILGNHECYDLGIAGARKLAAELAAEDPGLHYLSIMDEPVPLTNGAAIVGYDGWADGRCGDFLNTPIELNDFVRIPEFVDLAPQERFELVKKLGTETAKVLGERIEKAFENRSQVIVLTHVPPFREASRYNDFEANDEWGPHFVCQALGDELRRVADAYPDRQLTVLCGHAHHGADLQVGANLRVLTGDAKSGIPQLQGVVYVA